MREIKFRAWDKETKGMHYGGFSLHATGKVESIIFKPENLIVMQFTGLVARYAEEIYEGDIVANPEQLSRTGVVVWRRGDMTVETNDGNAFSLFAAEGRIVIVGNIYQNPELIKEQP